MKNSVGLTCVLMQLPNMEASDPQNPLPPSSWGEVGSGHRAYHGGLTRTVGNQSPTSTSSPSNGRWGHPGPEPKGLRTTDPGEGKAPYRFLTPSLCTKLLKLKKTYSTPYRSLPALTAALRPSYKTRTTQKQQHSHGLCTSIPDSQTLEAGKYRGNSLCFLGAQLACRDDG